MVPLVTIDTRNILFICGGAFPDLENIVKERLTRHSSIGFSAELKDKYDQDKNIVSKVTIDDLRAFGMIPEFIGRLPITVTLEGLNRDMMIRILKEPKNAILRQYQKLLALDEWIFDLMMKPWVLLRIKQLPERQVPEHSAPSLRNLCWILCMRSRRMTISAV